MRESLWILLHPRIAALLFPIALTRHVNVSRQTDRHGRDRFNGFRTQMPDISCLVTIEYTQRISEIIMEAAADKSGEYHHVDKEFETYDPE
jgi:hypothetical protein